MECPNCGSGDCVTRDGLQGMCMNCDTVWDVSDGTVTFWGTSPEDDDDALIWVCPMCGEELVENDSCDECGWVFEEDDDDDFDGWGEPESPDTIYTEVYTLIYFDNAQNEFVAVLYDDEGEAHTAFDNINANSNSLVYLGYNYAKRRGVNFRCSFAWDKKFGNTVFATVDDPRLKI